jgi:SPX domain protein involved in polyphosphate accumulation
MSFRIEEKLFIKKENLIQFQEFLVKKSVKKIHHPRIIESLYFDNNNLEMYSDSIEGLAPRKKIRIRNYPKDS